VNVTTDPPEPPTPLQVEWPTVLLIVLWAVTFTGVIVGHAGIPWFISIPALGLLSGLHFSLQHEVIHGHPTPWRRVNVALVGTPFALWCPYGEYRSAHLRHHVSELTAPGVDPESYHVTPETWARSGPIARRFLVANRTLTGRLLLGPWWVIVRTLRSAAAAVRRDAAARRMWCRHVVLAAVAVWIVVGLAGLPLWEYVVGVVWGGTALTMLRSFVEHRDTSGSGTPSAVVRSNLFFSVLYLNNNLHHTHHALPGAAWYRLPRLHVDLAADELAAAGAGWYPGYLDIARRHLVRPFGEPVRASDQRSLTA
jgi:fatty acid desaturase